MSPDRIRSILDKKPFRPFTIHTGDGSTVRVESREYAYLYPGGRTLLVVTGLEEGIGSSREQRIDVFLITKVTVPANGNGKRRRRQ